MKKIILTLSAMLFCAALFAAPTLSSLFPSFSEEKIEELKNGTTFEAYTCNGDKIADIAPVGSLGRSKALTGDRLYKGFSVAALSFIPYPDSFKAMSEEERRVELYNIIRSISTQKGLKYISHLAGDKPAVLFEDAYMVSDPDNKNSKIADPVSTSVPSSYSCYCMQKDNRFGKNVYSLNYTMNDGDFLMDINNYTTMKYMGFTCVDKGELNMYLEVIETEEGFLLYTMAIAKNRETQVKILFITVDLPSAFMRRITALKEWFVIRVNE
jgi:hypothetical protein